MPKPMFNNISKEKQQHFIQQSMLEFTEKPFEEVSILSLSKRIGISRGTFYNYFDTIGELFEYIFDIVKQQRHTYAFDLYRQSNHDVISYIKNLFQYDFDRFVEENKYSLLHNYIHYLHLSHRTFKDYFILPVLGPILEDSGDTLFDPIIYPVNEEEFYLALEILGSTISNLLVMFEKHYISKKEMLRKFDFMFNLVETGLKNMHNDD